VHFFSGTKEDACSLLDLGFSFSFGGVITFARDYDEVVHYIPMAHIMLETDAPYITPVPYRGKRNEPMYVVEVAKKLAEIKGMPYEAIAQQTTENARKLFGV
jgi:TatD DNase family protein